MKGSKRDRYLKDGIKESRKALKHIWNRKTRKSSKAVTNGAMFKKIKSESEWTRVS